MAGTKPPTKRPHSVTSGSIDHSNCIPSREGGHFAHCCSVSVTQLVKGETPHTHKTERALGEGGQKGVIDPAYAVISSGGDSVTSRIVTSHSTSLTGAGGGYIPTTGLKFKNKKTGNL